MMPVKRAEAQIKTEHDALEAKERFVHSRQPPKRIWRWERFPSGAIAVVAQMHWNVETTLASTWTVYIGIDCIRPGCLDRDSKTAASVAECGSPLPERIARAFFPDINLDYDSQGVIDQCL